jgi:hypothetical protein
MTLGTNGITHSGGGSTLGEILERVLDKGVVIAGDITVSIADVELLTIKIRLVVASIDKAVEMGIDWWKNDPALSTEAYRRLEKQKEQKEREKISAPQLEEEW